MANTGDISEINTEVSYTGGGVSPEKESYDGFNKTIFTSLDLEMNQPSGKIIQVGACVGDVITGEVFEKLRVYVKIDEPLDARIAALCRITQAQLDELGVPLVEAYGRVSALHRKYDTFTNALTWGGDDSGELQDQVFSHLGLGLTSSDQTKHGVMHSAGVPWVFGRKSIDIKLTYQMWALANGVKMRGGLARSLTRLGLNFQGTKHDACDDAFNTFRISHAMMKFFRSAPLPANT
jgi:inhibitor of KinA sporulation pathway (predicted exonuclease)